MKQYFFRLILGVCLTGSITACSSANNQNPSRQAERPANIQATAPLPTPTFVVSGSQSARRTPALSSAGGTTIRLDDDVWQGGYRRRDGNRVYGGRTATWIYGTATEYSTMQAVIDIAGRPLGSATLSIEGMDSEGAAKTPIRITINDVEIYNGPNPLPDDDQPLESGTWATYTWRFDAANLRAGTNTITISNLAVGAFSRPPFFMLDYADINYEAETTN